MVESIKLPGRPFGEYADDEQGVFEAWAFLCTRCKMSPHQQAKPKKVSDDWHYERGL